MAKDKKKQDEQPEKKPEESALTTQERPQPSPADLELGSQAYKAYGDVPGPHGKWTTYDGRPMPLWFDLHPLTQERWAIAASGIAERTVPKALMEFAKSEGWSPDFALHTLLEQRSNIKRLLDKAGGSDIDQARAVSVLIDDTRRRPDTELQHLLASGTHRALIISHTPAEGETYDEGRRYSFHTLEAVDGRITLKIQQELEPNVGGKLSNDMPFHMAFDWLWKRLNDWLKPRQYR